LSQKLYQILTPEKNVSNCITRKSLEIESLHHIKEVLQTGGEKDRGNKWHLNALLRREENNVWEFVDFVKNNEYFLR